MPAGDAQQLVMPSILTRLLDPQAMVVAAQPGASVRQLLDSVRDDLEDLFNTRQTGVVIPKTLREVQNSIVTFGLPDMTTLDINNRAQCERISHLLTEVIQRFEPRLRSVRVVVAKNTETTTHQVRFHIEGILAVDPNPEVGFDTVVELTTGKALVEAKELA
jgi:type VI secretion system protein ImpF